MKKSLPLFALALVALPLLAHAQTADDALFSQIQQLMQQVTALQQQVGQIPGTSGTQGISGIAQQAGVRTIDSSACPQIGRTLKPGTSGDDVTRLQQFLARDTSVYPEGQVSGYYGSLTAAAVRRWQTKFNIVSSGSAETTGYGVVGPRTAAAISLQCSSYGGGSSDAPVGGYIQVSPIGGNAPLTVNVQATVNTTNSCAGAIYTLNWGDGAPSQQIPVSAGDCTQKSQTYSHVYSYGGTYQVVLSAGSHRTTATVTVYGTAAPSGGNGGTIVPQWGTGVSYQANDTFNVSPLKGPAPLTVTFSGVVNSPAAGECTSNCANTLLFGDGTAQTVPLPMTGASQTYSLSHTYGAIGTYAVTFYRGMVSAGRIIGNTTVVVGGTGSGTTAAVAYGPFTVTPNVAGNPLSVSAAFALPSSCTGYQLSWGDGTSDIVQTDGGSGCAQSSVTQTFTHQYAQAGSYVITLRRGPTLATTDTATLTITQ